MSFLIAAPLSLSVLGSLMFLMSLLFLLYFTVHLTLLLLVIFLYGVEFCSVHKIMIRPIFRIEAFLGQGLCPFGVVLHIDKHHAWHVSLLKMLLS